MHCAAFSKCCATQCQAALETDSALSEHFMISRPTPGILTPDQTTDTRQETQIVYIPGRTPRRCLAQGSSQLQPQNGDRNQPVLAPQPSNITSNTRHVPYSMPKLEHIGRVHCTRTCRTKRKGIQGGFRRDQSAPTAERRQEPTSPAQAHPVRPAAAPRTAERRRSNTTKASWLRLSRGGLRDLTRGRLAPLVVALGDTKNV